MIHPQGRAATTVRWMPRHRAGPYGRGPDGPLTPPPDRTPADPPHLRPAPAFTPAGTIVVNSTADTGKRCDDPTATECTLRGAINHRQRQRRPGHDHVQPARPGAKFTPATALPPITQTDHDRRLGRRRGARRSRSTAACIPEDARPPRSPRTGALAEPLDKPKAKATRSSDDGVIRFLRPWGLDLRNADSSTIRGLIVHSFPYAQIGIDGTDAANVKGNWLGLKPDGSVSERKSTEDRMLGLSLINSAINVIGGPGADKNVISGNEIGIVADGPRARAATSSAATTSARPPTAAADRPNTETGILLTEPANLAGRGTEENRILGNVVVGDARRVLRHQHPRRQEDRDLAATSSASAPPACPSRRRASRSATTSASTSTTRPTPRSAAPARPSSTSSPATTSASRSTAARTARRSRATASAPTSTARAAGRPTPTASRVVADGLGEAPADVTVNENTIAGSSQLGMYVTGAAKRTKITNNRFGTDVDGVKKLPNKIGFATGRPAAAASAPTDLTFGPGNIVAGNRADGVQMLDGSGPSCAATGSASAPTTSRSATARSALNVQGDGTLVENNTVSANAQGVVVNGPTDDVVIRANRIGTAPSGEPPADFGNSGAGVLVMGNGGEHARRRLQRRRRQPHLRQRPRRAGRRASATDTTIRQNVIGLDTTGDASRSRTTSASSLAGGTNTVVGGALGIDARNLHRPQPRRRHPHQRRQAVGDHRQLHHRQPRPGRARRRHGRRRGDRLRRRRRRRASTTSTAARRAATGSRTTRAPGVRVTGRRRQITVRGNRMRANTGLDVDLDGPARPPTTSATPTTGRTRRPASLPIKASGEQPRRIGGQLDRFDAARDADRRLRLRVHGRPPGPPARRRVHRHRVPGRARRVGARDRARRTPAYGAVMTDQRRQHERAVPAVHRRQRRRRAVRQLGDRPASTTTPTARPTCACRTRAPTRPSPTCSSRSTGRQAASRTWRAVQGQGGVRARAPPDQPAHGDRRAGARRRADQRRRPLDRALRRRRRLPRRRERRRPVRRLLRHPRGPRGRRLLAHPRRAQARVPLRDLRPPREGRALRRGRPGRRRVPRHARRLPARGHHARRRLRRARLQPPVRRVRRRSSRPRCSCTSSGTRSGCCTAATRPGENNEPNYLSVMNYWYLTRGRRSTAGRWTTRARPRSRRDEAAFDEALPFYDNYPQRAERAVDGSGDHAPTTPARTSAGSSAGRADGRADRPQRRRRVLDASRWASTTSTST